MDRPDPVRHNQHSLRGLRGLFVAVFAAAWCLPVAAKVGTHESHGTSAGQPGEFHMPVIAPPAIPGNGVLRQTGPRKIGPGSTGWKQLRLENGWLFARGGGVSGLRLTDIDAKSHGTILHGSDLPGLRVERVRVLQGTAGSGGSGIATVWNGADGAVFRDLTYVGDPARPAPNNSHPWAAIALAGKKANDTGTFLIDRFDFQNVITAPGKRYPNADGIATERGYSGRITNGRVTNASDACLDIKGDVSVDNVYLSGCREGIKSWSNQKHGLIAMGTNRVAAILGAGSRSAVRSIYIDTLILDGNPAKPILRAENGVFNVTIGTLVAAENQKLLDDRSFKGSTVKVLRRVVRH